ncbi:uncharacterized protein [Amphiura filiformis]|uniref:uncharacterized protein n=1 Tax=Amphiura filiformis TaxID=82378 RepID=UPI003B210546
MAGLRRTYLLILFAGILVRNTLAQDTCAAGENFALFVHNDGVADTQDGIYRATTTFDAGSDFTKQPFSTTENPTAVFYDVVNDLVYWAGNDADIGRYIKRDAETGGTAQATSLITCTGTPLGIENGDIQDGDITASDFFTAPTAPNPTAGPTRARLDQPANLPNELGAWIPGDDDAPPMNWIEVNLFGRATITGVTLQGRHDAPMWTQTYEVQYSQDYVTWSTVPDAAGNNAVFIGNTDQVGKVTQTFATPVVALYLRIVPLTWYYDNTLALTDDTVVNRPALRFELEGCKVPQCRTTPSIVTDGSILNSQYTASSGTASNARYMTGTAWTATTNGIAPNEEWVTLFLGGRATISSVIIEAGSTTEWVTEVTVRASQDGVIWTDVVTGQSITDIDGTTLVQTINFPSVSATHIQIRVTDTQNDNPVQMSFDVRGCRDPEITRLAVDGTCAARKVYWIERGQQSIFYSNLEATNPTTGSFLSVSSGTIVDIELDVENDLIYFAQQDGTSSLIKRARLSTESVLNTVTVSTANRNIQSISIDWDTERVYYSINADASGSGVIGYVNLDLSGNTLISTITGNTAGTFYPFDIGVYGDYVYALENKDSIIRVMKSLSGTTTATTNVRETVVSNRLACDLQFVECINFQQ